MDNSADFWKSILWWWRGFPLLLFVVSQTIAASFYGDGFVLLKAVESSVRTSLHVRFRTAHSSGVLFLAAGDTDFCLVELHSGRIQVSMDLGSGVRSLRSEKGVQLNDLVWHTMELRQDQRNVTLTVDKHSHTSLRMLGPDLELSIQDGLFVGGLGGLERPYLSTERMPVGFRGCLDEVLFNQHNLLSSLRPYSGYKTVHEVSLGCSPEFSASADDSINFFSSRAYMSLPTWDMAQEGVFECQLHRSAKDGIILYSSASEGHYIAIELQDDHVVAVIGAATMKTKLRSPLPVSEHDWHQVKLHLSTLTVHLCVGADMQNSSLGLHTNALQLSGPLFIGGLDGNTRVQARKKGLRSLADKQIGGGSLRGCLKHIRVNAQKMGLPNAMVTKDASVGCETETFDSITTPSPIPAPGNGSVGVSGADCKRGQSFLVLENLIVPEGGRAPLGFQHVKMNVEIRSLGISQSQIMFRIAEQPVHGQLRLDVDPEQEEHTFSLLDLWHGRVMYVHGGSEDQVDFFIFSVFSSSKRQLPACIRGNKLHRFNISITPSNDAPELSFPEGSLFVLLEQSKRRLTTDMLRVIDPDSNSTDLIFTVLGNLNTDAGFLEIEDDPGQAIKNFSYLNLEQGKVYYVHTGIITNSRMALRVSDGDKVSNTAVLRLMAVPLEYKVVNNTGAEVTQGGWALLSSTHLAVQVNVAQQVVELRYDVAEPPQYGELQRLHSSGEWKNTWIFSQKLLEKDRIRYLSTYLGSHPGNVTDSFRFRVTIGSTTTEEMLFPIVVQGIHYKVIKSKMEVDTERRVTLTPQDLRAVSKGMKILESDLYFLLLSLPKKGDLLLDDKVLRINSTFSQKTFLI
ncbi:chondroitin sulfate proteoglycan 4 [Clupea harengus]|uniref:Chondroitin sulfate proteoglycan 4 n=1 Tax=Clupea harengus TaxID=7950 RepID=A0A6P8G213_CLUHA|nr:chondroitin sulfate proteoglycan 4 [Clupea harengus]